MTQTSPEVRRCEATTAECVRVCSETLSYSLERGGRYAEPRVIETLLDCIQACKTATDYMVRGSDLSDEACGLCVQACERCAEVCGEFSGDAQMRACAETCRECITACRGVAAAA